MLLWGRPCRLPPRRLRLLPGRRERLLSLFRWNAFSTTQRFVGIDNYAALGRRSSLLERARQQHRVRDRLCRVPGRRWSRPGGHRRGVRATAVARAACARSTSSAVTISITVTALLFQFLYHPRFGLVNEALVAIGRPEWTHSWLGESATAIWAIIAMSQWQSVGYIMVLFIVAMQKIPRELYDAAYIDGATRTRAFFRVTVPLLSEMRTLLVIITISGAFLVFNEVKVMTDGGPANASQVLGTWLYRAAFRLDDMGYASAIATVLFVITFTAAIAQLRRPRQAVEY